MPQFEKAAWEEFYRYYDFKNVLADGETVDAANVIITELPSKKDMSSDMVEDVGPYQNTMARYKIKGGAAGKQYSVTVHITTSTGQKFSNDYHEVLTCQVKR